MTFRTCQSTTKARAKPWVEGRDFCRKFLSLTGRVGALIHLPSRGGGKRMSVEIVNIVAGPNGEAVFSDQPIEFRADAHVPGASPSRSHHEAIKRFFFLELPTGWVTNTVFADRRQLGFCMAGKVRFNLPDGTSRDFEAGSTWRLIDVNVTGLTIEVVGSEPATCMIAHID